MRLQAHILGLATGCEVDEPQGASAIADDRTVSRRIDADVVGVAAELDCSTRFVVVAIEQSYRTVAGIGDEERIARWLLADPLRLAQSGNGADQATIGEVDNADSVIAKFRHEQSLSFQVDRHVIDPATHSAEQNLGFEL
jgi:hypothetical protein